jgi:hypothetical protein
MAGAVVTNTTPAYKNVLMVFVVTLFFTSASPKYSPPPSAAGNQIQQIIP